MSAQTHDLNASVVETLTIADAAMAKAAEDRAQQAAKAAAVANAIPAAVKALVDHERIKPDQAEKMAAALRDPVNAIAVITKLAAHGAPPNLGQGVAKESAAAPARRESPFVGGRGDGRTRESDRRLFAAMGLAPPSEE